MSLPQVTVNPPVPDHSRETDIQIDLSKRITPDIGVTIRDQWQRLKPTDLPAVAGLGALQTGAQYQLFVNGPHEALGRHCQLNSVESTFLAPLSLEGAAL